MVSLTVFLTASYSMLCSSLTRLFVALVFLAPLTCLAQLSKVSNILVGSNKMVRDSENQRIDLNGNVQIVFQDMHLFSRNAVVDLKTKTVIATGDVSVLTPTQSINGDRLEMNYETGLGIAFNGFVQSGSVTFQGDIIRKVGPNEYEVENGEYTACKTCPPAWSFSGKTIKAELGGYAHIKHAIFRIASYPFFWLPYLILPLKSRRQSGFLFPSFSSEGESGATLAESFFWAIDPHSDMTFTLKNYSNRGLKGLVNYRFFSDIESYGEFSGAYINDRLFPSSERLSDNGGKSSIDRWFLKYFQYYQLPGDFIQRTQLNLVSDIQYIEDFQRELNDRNGDPALENRVSITKNTENVHFSTEAALYINLLKTEAKSDNNDAVHRLPDIKLSFAEKRIGESHFTGQLDVAYTNFARNNFGFDDITFNPSEASGVIKRFNGNRDGTFDSDGVTTSDQIRAGQRFDLEPKIAYDLKLGPYLDVLPSASYRHTGYDFGFGDNPSASRNYVRTELSMLSRFGKVYYGETEIAPRYRHEVIPEITYTNVPFFKQSDHPFFGNDVDQANFRGDQPITDADFFDNDTGLQFDYFDRLIDRDLVQFSLTNTLTKREWSGTEAVYRQIGLFRLSQSYDVIEARKADNVALPWSDIEAFLNLSLRNVSTTTQVNYFPYHKVANVSTRLRVNDSAGRFAQIIYNLGYPIGTDIAVDRSGRSENISLQTGFGGKYFFFLGNINYSVQTAEITSWRYDVTVNPPGNCWGFIFSHFLDPGQNLVDWSFNFSYSFDGKKSVSLTDSIGKLSSQP